MTPEDHAIHIRNYRRMGHAYWNYWMKPWPARQWLFWLGKAGWMLRYPAPEKNNN